MARCIARPAKKLWPQEAPESNQQCKMKLQPLEVQTEGKIFPSIETSIQKEVDWSLRHIDDNSQGTR